MELKLILESLLFTSQKPLSPVELRDVLTRAAVEEGADESVKELNRMDPDRILAALQELAGEHEAGRRSYRLVCVAGAWQFVTEPMFSPWLRSLLGVKNRPSRLSQPALETLAIIAYRQPITRAEMEQIRGVAVDGVIASLTERGLILQSGRAEVVGRPMQYSTTAGFLEYLGLGGLEDLPDASELRRIPVQRPVSLLTVDPGLVTVPDALVSLEVTGDLGLSLSPSMPAEISKANLPSESVQGSESSEST
ncbi:MAG: SMC-Scp complex subunit ScpB [Pedosphaera sp.]|nr:SMC-Scp complex subunit ScpB [Pedosphaera sp.]